MTNPSWIPRAAALSASHSWSLGAVFAEYSRLEGRTLDEVAATLGCNMDTLGWLSLCRRPSSERFSEDLQVIVKRFPVDTIRLSEIIRRVAAIEALRKGKTSADDTTESLLLAARDRDDEEKK